MKTPLRLFIAAATLANALAEPVILTDLQGRALTATINLLAGDDVTLSRADGKQFKIKLATLDAASQALVKAAKIIPQETRVRIRAQSVAAGRDAQTHWKASWGSYDQNITRTRMASATVECTLGGGPAEIVTQWISSVAGQASNQSVAKIDRTPITLAPGSSTTEFFAATFEESDLKLKALGERYQSGEKYVGWIIRIIAADGQELAAQGSRPTLPDLFPLPKAEKKIAEK